MRKKAPPTPEKLERDRLLRRALLLPRSPHLGEFRLRPFSLWTLDLCEEVGLDFFLRLPEGVTPAGSRTFQLAALVWFHDADRPVDEVGAALQSGAWRDAVRTFTRDPRLERSLDAIGDYLAFFSRLIAAASVKVKKRPKQKGEKEEVDPPEMIEPGQAYALAWSITGGSVKSTEEFDAVYRGMPLPIVLSFYHCALRAALVWTIPPTMAKPPVDPEKEKRAKAARAALFSRPPARDV